MANTKHFIPPPPSSKEIAFEIRDTLTVFEAAMVYAGRHPLPRFLAPGSIEDKLRFLRAGIHKRERVRACRSWDIYCVLIDRIKYRGLNPIKSAHLEDGGIDPFRTVIRIDDLTALADERGERPKYLKPFLKRIVDKGRPLTEKAASKFARDYINNSKSARKRPTQSGLERAAKDAKLRGGREFLRAAFRKMQGGEVRPGRPRTKFAEK